MEKKIYVPNEEELYTMQEMGVNVYNYLLAKVIEVLTLEGIKYPKKGILKTAYKYFQENTDIAYPICRMYPNELQYSQIARNEVPLCLDMLNQDNDKSIYRLDNLIYFDEGVQTNTQVSEEVIKILGIELLFTPQYRFEYKSSEYTNNGVSDNVILNNIFSGNYDTDFISNEKVYKNLMTIEPAYALKISDRIFSSPRFSESREVALRKSVGRYLGRYSLTGKNSEYLGQDILTNPNKKTKQLIKCLKENKNNIY